MTLPQFIGVGTAQWTASNGAAIPSMSPVDGAIGDLLLLVIERSDSTAAPTVTNWTNVAAATGTNSTVQSTGVYWKVATSATGTSDATGTITWGTTTTTRGGVVLRFRDTSAVAPVHNSNIANVASTATTVNATNFSTTVNNCIAVFVASMVGARSTTNTTTNWPAATGVTAFASQQTSLGGDETIGYGSKTFATAGSLLTPGIVWTTNTTTGTGQGILIALREQFSPNAPTSSAATSVTNAGFTANWSAPATDSTHDAATGYRLDVATDAGFSSLVVGFNNLDVGNVTTKAVTGLAAGTAYWYQVRAYNNNATASGNSSAQQQQTRASTADTYGSAVINTTGLVSYWRLDEASGQALDAKSTNDSTTATAISYSQTGLLTGTTDTAFGFNGSTSNVSVPFTSALNPAVFSIEAWAKIATAGVQQIVVSDGWSSGNGAALLLESRNVWAFGVASVITDNNTYTPPHTSPFHVVGTYDGANAALYVNGVLVAGPTAATYTANASLALSLGNFLGTSVVNGTIDEVALYNVALDATTISNHYTLGSTSSIPPGLGPVVSMQQPFISDMSLMR